MVGTGKGKNRRTGSLLLLILFALGLACLGITGDAESRTSDGRWVVKEWDRRYRGPGDLSKIVYAMAVDGLGNVYVTGCSVYSQDVSDYLTIKYSPEGQLLWAKVYNGGNSYNGATAMVVDSQGNVYVTGYSGSYNHYSGAYYTIATIKYSPDGQELWVQNYNKSGGGDIAWAIARDGQDNVYVTGNVTIKYSPDGQELWVRDFNGQGTAIAVDAQGIAGVTGYSWKAERGWDYCTIKYSSEGQRLWKRLYNGPGNGDDYATSLAVDGQSNICVTGSSWGSGTKRDYATVKYSADGRRLWVRRYRSVGSGSDSAVAIAMDGQGNVYVTGDSPDGRITTIKYAPDGHRLWVRRHTGSNGESHASAMAIDGQSNVYVTGDEWGGDSWKTVTIKYNPEGNRLWVRRYQRPDNLGDYASAIALDSQGNVYISGESWASEFLIDYLTIKYMQAP